MSWEIRRTDAFSKEFKKHIKDGEFIKALERKIERLKENPENIGGFLSGKLHGRKSARIIRKFRLIFKIVFEQNCVYLEAIHHRKFDYEIEID